ncbi:sugar ABC transporter permease [bacterium]|nr:sugar ABC transporter permease [bacterium]
MKNILAKCLNNDKLSATFFLLPAILGGFIFIIIPIFFSFYLSFTKWDLLSPIEFVGLENYIELFKSDIFYQILRNTILFAVITTLFGVIIPLFLACIVNSKIKCSEFFKTVYFLPFITPMVVLAIVWAWIFDPNIGLMNYILKTNINWLFDEKWAMVAILIVSVWKLIGYNMVIFLSGLTAISSTLYEAAKIDGANALQTFFKITIPQLSPTIFFVIIITTISSFQVFDLIYLMTQGGPLNSTNVLVYWLYQSAFEQFKIGQASAIAYILFTIIFVLTLIQFKIKNKWVNED